MPVASRPSGSSPHHEQDDCFGTNQKHDGDSAEIPLTACSSSAAAASAWLDPAAETAAPRLGTHCGGGGRNDCSVTGGTLVDDGGALMHLVHLSSGVSVRLAASARGFVRLLTSAHRVISKRLSDSRF